MDGPIALGLVLLGLLLVVLSKRRRSVRGLGSGEAVALDNLMLFGERLKLTGRPDRITRENGRLIPEELKRLSGATAG
jgi:LPXTG-motif cell wall-anchored protein